MTPDTIKAALKELQEERFPLQERLKSINQTIDTLISICPHEYKYDGHGHNESYEICIICNHTRTV